MTSIAVQEKPREVVLLYSAAVALNDSEQQVVLDLANGYSQKLIAHRAGYTEPGIQVMLRRLRKRFGADSNIQLVGQLMIMGVLL